MPIRAGLEQSYSQLKALLMHRPPQPLRARINQAWISEKRELEDASHDSPANKIKRATIHPFYLYGHRSERVAIDR
ncbi:hypothetical protein [Marinomonas sp.]|uniref:hypothetical protein n=1 Tax=Marinomonas sp. TaxID=1904862 RepID=UPI003F9E60D7